jgi:hypothetical protein
MKMDVPVFGAYMFRIDISSWWIVPFINMKWPSLSLLIDFSVKSTLSDIIIAMLPAYGVHLLGKLFSTLWL